MIEQIAVVIAGMLAPFIINVFKGNVHGKPAFALSVMTSVALALGLKLLLPPLWGGIAEPIEPEEALGAIGQVFALATIVYKVFLEKHKQRG